MCLITLESTAFNKVFLIVKEEGEDAFNNYVIASYLSVKVCNNVAIYTHNAFKSEVKK